MEEKKSIFNLDGWRNVLAGLGYKYDKTEHTTFGNYTVLDDDTLSRMWVGDGLGKKIVSAPADDMIRNWITVQNDQNNKITDELIRLNAKTEVNLATKWSRLYRGSLIVVGVDDGKELEEPLNLNAVRGINWLKVFSAPEIYINETDIVEDPNSKYFNDIEIFPIYTYSGKILRVHNSRCLLFKGEPVPQRVRSILGENNFYWGMSILQSIWDQLRNQGGAEKGASNLLFELVIGVFKLSNLEEILSQNNTQKIYNRINVINASKSLINAVLLGKDEEFSRNTANLAGVPELLDRFMIYLAAVAEIPVTRLFGRSPAGQNSTGESDLTNYYDMIMAKQDTWLSPPIQKLINLIGIYTKVQNPKVDFNPVWEPTQKELIEMKNKQAQTDQIYLDYSVLSSEEVREQRFGGGYSFETNIEEG